MNELEESLSLQIKCLILNYFVFGAFSSGKTKLIFAKDALTWNCAHKAFGHVTCRAGGQKKKNGQKKLPKATRGKINKKSFNNLKVWTKIVIVVGLQSLRSLYSNCI